MSVLNEEDPRVVGGHDSISFHFLVMSLGTIVRNSQNGEAGEETNTDGNNAHSAPVSLRAHSSLEKWEWHLPW